MIIAKIFLTITFGALLGSSCTYLIFKGVLNARKELIEKGVDLVETQHETLERLRLHYANSKEYYLNRMTALRAAMFMGEVAFNIHCELNEIPQLEVAHEMDLAPLEKAITNQDKEAIADFCLKIYGNYEQRETETDQRI
jgi:hypothetical protein